MKIIIVSPSLNTNRNVSGISSVVQFIIKNNSEHQYYHFANGKKDDETRNLLWILRIIISYLKWTWLLITLKDVIIHFNLSLSRLSLIRDYPLIILARLLRKKMVIHIHGGELLIEKKSSFWFNRILKSILSGRNPVVVLSPLEKEILFKKSGCNIIFILPNCIEIKEAQEFLRTYEKTEVIRLLFLGRISVTKGIEYIYKALKSLKKQGADFKFFIAGVGPDQTKYIQKFKDLLGDDFEYKGIVSGYQKSELLKNCDVYLLPSFHEGLPMSLIESMSFGLVPVTTDVGSIKYAVIDGVTGIFVKKQSPEDISNAILKLLQEKEYLQKLSMNARQHIFNINNPDKYITSLNEIYNI